MKTLTTLKANTSPHSLKQLSVKRESSYAPHFGESKEKKEDFAAQSDQFKKSEAASSKTPKDPFLLKQIKKRASSLLKKGGIGSIKIKNPEQVASLSQQSYHLILAANHRGYGDSLIACQLSKQLNQPTGFFKQLPFPVPKTVQNYFSSLGIIIFSGKKGLKESALEQAKKSVKKGSAPLIIFPEGGPSYQNNRVKKLFHGTAKIALSAASETIKNSDKNSKNKIPVAIIPMGIKYHYEENVLPSLKKYIDELELALNIKGSPKNSSIENTKKRVLKLWETILKRTQDELFPKHPFYGDLERRYKQLKNALIVSLCKELNITYKAELPIFGLLKKLGKAIDQRKTQASEHIPSEAIEKLCKQWNALAAIHFSSPAYIQGYPSQERLVESVHCLNHWVSNENRALRTSIIEDVGSRRVTIEYGQPIYMSNYLNIPYQSQEKTLQNITNQLRQNLQKVLD